MDWQRMGGRGLTLEAVKAAGLGDLDVGGEAAGKVLEDDAIGGGKEGENVLDEVPLIVGQLLPVRGVLRQIDLLNGPEGSLRGRPALGMDVALEASPRCISEGRPVKMWAPRSQRCKDREAISQPRLAPPAAARPMAGGKLRRRQPSKGGKTGRISGLSVWQCTKWMSGGGAGGHLMLLVHLPDLVVLDGEEHEAVGVG